MTKYSEASNNIQPLQFRRLSRELLDTAAEMCDVCVGKNLYTVADLELVLHQPGHCFYILYTSGGEPAAYIYFSLTDLESLSTACKMPVEKLSAMSEKEAPLVGQIQSIGVLPEYRQYNLGDRLMAFALDYMEKNTEADLVSGIAWKPEGRIPMKNLLDKYDCKYLGDSKNVWYDCEGLVCPVCGGRCSCDAAVYYKLFERDGLK